MPSEQPLPATDPRSYAVLAARALAAPPRLGPARLVCVDGPSGAGKSTCAAHLHAALESVIGGPLPLVHLDDAYEGWGGLSGIGAKLEAQVLAPLRRGEPGRLATWDWHADGPGAYAVVPCADVLVVEGCGAGDRAVAAYASLLVWVDAPAELRLGRVVARDGEHLRPELEAWVREEQQHFAREGTRERADIPVDGATGP